MLGLNFQDDLLKSRLKHSDLKQQLPPLIFKVKMKEKKKIKEL